MTEKLFLIERREKRHYSALPLLALLDINQDGADFLQEVVGFALKEPEDFEPDLYNRIKLKVEVGENNVIFDKLDGPILVVAKDHLIYREVKGYRKMKRPTEYTMNEISLFLFQGLTKYP